MRATLLAVALAAGAAAPAPPAAPIAIAFTSATTGIAISDEGLARTVNGGRSWERVRSSGGVKEVAFAGATALAVVERERPCAPCATLVRSGDRGVTFRRTRLHVRHPFLLDSETGWAFSDPRGTLVATADGGRTWHARPPPCRGGADAFAAMSFVSRSRGWLLCTSQPGAGQQPKAVYATRDGGRHWQLVMSAGYPSLRRSSRGAVDLAGYPGGIAFVPGGHGWMWEQRGWMWETRDGGRTWRRWSAAVPELVEYDAVAFADSRHGFLLRTDANRGRVDLLGTSDAGMRWRLVRASPR